MSSKKAFVDTTVLTDGLLKRTKGRIARTSLDRFDETLLPVYAIKEFKQGPLRYYRWAYNILTTTRSFGDTITALHRLALTPQRNLHATSLETLAEWATGYLKNHLTSPALVSIYGSKATLDESLADSWRLAIKTRLYNAWDERRELTTSVVQELPCYTESDPYENERNGHIELDDRKCKPIGECSLGPGIRRKISEVRIVADIVKDQPKKRENTNRYRILHEIARKPTAPLPEDYCIGLGDAYFALFCPKDVTILTTNTKDHKPLANALGKHAERPKG